MSRLGFLVLVLCIGNCAGCANQLLLHPSTDRMDLPGATSRLVRLPGGGVIQVWIGRTSAAAPQAYVVRFCGNGERAEDALRRDQQIWEALPVEIDAMNYPGFGGSSGPAALSAIPAAAVAVFDDVHARHPSSPIFLSGFSLGSAAALYVARQRPVSGLLLRNTPPIRQVITGQYGWWNLWLLAGPLAAGVPPQLDSIENGRHDTAPAIFVIAGSDELVPRKYQRFVTAAYAGEKRVIVDDGAHHNSPLAGAALAKVQADLRWLWARGVAVNAPTTRKTRGAHARP